MTVVNDGLAAVAALMAEDTSGSANTFRAIAVGTGTTAVAYTQSTLDEEVKRQDTSQSQETSGVSNDTIRFDTNFTFSTNYAITEYGIFDNVSDNTGTMLDRIKDDPMNVSSGDQISVTIDITFGRG